MEGIDTQQTPEPSGQSVEPTPVTEQVSEQVVTTEAIPPPAQLTPEEIEERAFQRTASWTGRELKKFQDSILQSIGEQISRIPRPEVNTAPPPSTIDTSTLLENPSHVLGQFVRREDIPKILNETVQNNTRAEQQFRTDVIKSAADIMDSNPLFADKELGNEVANEIIKTLGTIDRRLDKDVAGELLVTRAVTNIVRNRAQAGKPNALSGNRPAGPGNGTLKAPAPPQAKIIPIKLDPQAERIAAMFGNTTEDIQRHLGKQ